MAFSWSPCLVMIMSMTRIICDFRSIQGTPVGDSAAIASTVPRPSDDLASLILPAEEVAPVVDGIAVFDDVEPGPARVQLRARGYQGATWRFVVPESGEALLSKLVAESGDYTPPQIRAATTAARAAQEAARVAEEARDAPGRQGEPGPPGPAGPVGPVGPMGPEGPRSSGPQYWHGQGAPPEVIIGARPGDCYVDVLTGDIYQLE